jgi:hypothetical protein
MSEGLDRTASGAVGPDRGARGIADGLGFASTPAFALMAWLACLPSGNMAMICAASPGPSWLGGMAPMYLLMSGLHAGPWLKVIASRRRRDRRAADRHLGPP